MTRINVVPATELTREHLQGEYKEITRVFNLVRKRVDKGHTVADMNIPETYRLGSGHVTFFYDKLQYIHDRYLAIVDEMLNRGYSPNLSLVNDICDSAEKDIPLEWWNNYTPTTEALEANRQRITERKKHV